MTNDCIWEQNPSTQGWYATLHGWDEDEGVFPDASYWNGTSWERSAQVVAYAGPFESESAAKEWAQAHDPDK